MRGTLEIVAPALAGSREGHPPSLWAGEGPRADRRQVGAPLDVQVLHIERVVFDELASGLHVLTHQSCKDGFALGDIFELH